MPTQEEGSSTPVSQESTFSNIDLRDLKKRVRMLKIRGQMGPTIRASFRVSRRFLSIINLIASHEGRSPSALMRELLIVGLADYVTVYYKTPKDIERWYLSRNIIAKAMGLERQATRLARPGIKNRPTYVGHPGVKRKQAVK